MTNTNKFIQAVKNLRPGTEFSLKSPVENETGYNLVLWNIGVDDNKNAIQSTTCPHTELNWIAVKQEMDNL